jgi:hypothetical protein
MHPEGEITSAEKEISDDPRRVLVQRITADPHFRRSARLRDFLTYICEQALDGHTEILTERQIGCAVFGRKPDYNPVDDNIVRVHARQLRVRLEEYFQGDGRAEPLVVEIPKGSYVPVFHSRTVPARAAANGEASNTPASSLFLTSASRFLLAVCAVLALSCALLWVQNRRLRESPQRLTARQPWMLAAVFEPQRVTTAVVPDSMFGIMQGLLRRPLTLEDYLRPDYPESLISGDVTPEQSRWLRSLHARPYTTFPEVIVAERLARMAERNQWRLVFRFPRDLNARDFTEGNYILLGSKMSNPWVALFERDLNFKADWDPKSRVPCFRNTTPVAGEAPTYRAEKPNGLPGYAYAVAALVIEHRPDSTPGSKVLILEGLNMEGSEAAYDFASDWKASQEVSSSLTTPDRQGRRVEILLQTKAMAGTARGIRVVAVRSAK